jgi:hypothetical protein
MSILERQLRRRLAKPTAPRVLTAAMLVRLAEAERPGTGRATVTGLVKRMETDGALRKVTRGVYLNRCMEPPAAEAEAAEFLRRGAIVSLHTVLGDAGVLNNYTHDVWCVVPLIAKEAAPSLRTVRVQDDVAFVFHGISEERLFAPARDDLMAEVPYPRATPEAAICHWLYLSQTPRSPLKLPPRDVDLDGVDMDRVHRIAAAMDVKPELGEWLATLDREYEQGVAPGLGF